MTLKKVLKGITYPFRKGWKVTIKIVIKIERHYIARKKVKKLLKMYGKIDKFDKY